MRKLSYFALSGVVLSSLLWLTSPGLAASQVSEIEALKGELAKTRELVESLAKTMQGLQQRLEQVEKGQEKAAGEPAREEVAKEVTPAPVVSQTPPGPVSPMELARPREPFALYERRGPGQLLFDVGIAGDFIGNLTQGSVDKADAGTFAGRENRFFPREIELSLFGQVDPYARAEVRIEAGEETAGQEIELKLAEANLTLLTLPWGTQLKLGQMRNRFLYSNVFHEHDLPWPDRPNVLRNFLGEEGLVEKGAELTVVPDLPFYLEALVGAFNGDNETAFGRGKLNHPLVTGRLRTFLELTDTSALQLGASVASGDTAEQRQSTLAGYELRYKYRPEGWLHPLLTLGGEGLYSIRRTTITDSVTGLTEDRTRRRFGWYGYGELQPFQVGPLSRWALGVRYDWSEFPENPGHERAIEPYLTFWPSEFLRFRLAYKNTDQDDNGGSARHADEYLFEATFILGAHPAHPF